MICVCRNPSVPIRHKNSEPNFRKGWEAVIRSSRLPPRQKWTAFPQKRIVLMRMLAIGLCFGA